MTITVQLRAYLKKFAPSGTTTAFSIELPDNATAEDLMARLKIEPKHRPVVMINGSSEARTAALHDGDSVLLMPQLSGG